MLTRNDTAAAMKPACPPWCSPDQCLHDVEGMEPGSALHRSEPTRIGKLTVTTERFDTSAGGEPTEIVLYAEGTVELSRSAACDLARDLIDRLSGLHTS